MLPELYDRLRILATGYLAQERPDHTLQPTALVHEAYLRMSDQCTVGFRNRLQFLGVAAVLMRRILVDHARSRNALKRGRERTGSLEGVALLFQSRSADLLELDEALGRLEMWDPQKSKIVELRFFGGMTMEETARHLGIPLRTAERQWTLAKTWLRYQLGSIG